MGRNEDLYSRIQLEKYSKMSTTFIVNDHDRGDDLILSDFKFYN